MVLDFNTFQTLPNLDKLFEEMVRPRLGDTRRLGYPPLNLSSDDDSVHVRAEIPGMNMDDIELTLTDKTLVIKGERTAPTGRYFRQERPAGVFHRVVNLNVPVDRDNVRATMKDGVLSVVLPKAAETRPKRIEIGAE